MDRRSFLAIAAAAVGGAVVGARIFGDRGGAPGAPTSPMPLEGSSTSAPPVSVAAGDITGHHAGGFTVPAGQTRRIRGLVTTDANVIVEGRLEMRAGDTLRFVDVDESVFVGEGMDPLPTDVGLWVMGAGVLDAQGTPKEPWNRAGDASSWTAGDELVVAPTGVGDTAFAPFARGSEVPRAHPSVPAAEVLNLTRDCTIEGTPGHRSHVFIRSTSPQVIRHVGLLHLGPRKDDLKVAGRWPLHFHHNMHSQHGVVVEGVVVRNAGSHAFVAHNSNGITFRQCIAYDVHEDAYWWDPDTAEEKQGEAPVNFTDDTTYDRCVAAVVRIGDEGNGLRLCGFNLGKGLREGSNRCVGCVGVGVLGGSNCSGFGWQENMQGPPWVFENNVAHNNAAHGLFTWQNLGPVVHTMTAFTSYRNLDAGVAVGAYEGAWQFEAPVLVENALSGVLQHARSMDATYRGRYDDPVVIGSSVAFREGDVNFPDQLPVIVTGAQVSECPMLVDESNETTPTFEFLG
ncbi:MAG: hypothetical protein ACXWW5_00915 [Actinomycetota bacterium]